MIRSFRHKGLAQFFETGSTRGINADHGAKLGRQLAVLNTATVPDSMNLPGYRLHQLKGSRNGQWAVWVSGNWRLVFAFDGPDAVDVDLIDYH